MSTFDDAQRLVVYAFGFHRVRHFLLKVRSAPEARTFIGTCAGEIARVDRKSTVDGSTADGKSIVDAVCLAVTFPGLQALMLRDEYLEPFRKLAPAFAHGAAARAAQYLGDTGRNAPERWEQPFLGERTHLLLSIYADDTEQLDLRAGQLRRLDPHSALAGWEHPMDGAHLGKDRGNRREHFGFRDGISQPAIAGAPQSAAAHPQRNRVEVPAGEFLLGHPNADTENLWSDDLLPAPVRKFVANGSFFAFRKMQQHVDRFHLVNGLTQAKMCGRWPNGAIVEPNQQQPPTTVQEHQLNAFDFSQDAQGDGCPFASHVRRMNPRSDPVIPRAVSLMRRGVPYSSGTEKGILGIFLCASLERQFEFLLRDWGTTPPMNPTHDLLAEDPLISGNPANRFRSSPDGPPQAITHLGNFVTTKGTLYGFYPSAAALAMIGRLTD